MNRLLIFAATALLFFPTGTSAQDWDRIDTLDAAVKTDSRRVAEALGQMTSSVEGVRRIISPLGEGDPIRWAQSLPGVTTGADGTTAFYVRGGNMGNNLITLDGTPVYGYSHLLGLTTIVPQEIMSDASLHKGGFEGSSSNFTAGHLKITTRDPNREKFRMSAALNNFLASVSVESPISDKMSFMLSGRISPLAWEYKAVRGMLPDLLGGFEDFGAGVGDLYGKFRWQTGKRSVLNASFLGSMDGYSFDSKSSYEGISYRNDEKMGWNNIIGTVNWHIDGNRSFMDLRASVNRYTSSQEQRTYYRGVWNHLTLLSSLTEYMLSFDRTESLFKAFKMDYGTKFRLAEFAPGQVASVNNRSDSFLGTVYLQGRYDIENRLSIRATLRGHYYRNMKDEAYQVGQKKILAGRFDYDASVFLNWKIFRYLSLEATFDRMVQHYHTLEGLPVGWSLDMIVPSSRAIVPENALQGNVGLSSQIGKHTVSAGGFYKEMDNLVYYKYAQSLFSGGMASWENDVDMGQGTSYGAELLHEYVGKDLYTRVSYTWSKTNRFGFKDINEGEEFHARFDRRHVLNAVAQWKGFSAAVTLQSGHWENGAAETYPMHVPGGEWTADYFSGVNNYHMPTVFRLDLGYMFSFETGKVKHDVNVGVCNVTNHFNPFMLYFDPSTEGWKMIALLPILPNFSYRISF